MGHNSDKAYVTHSEHSAGLHTASSTGKRADLGKSEFQRLPFDSCALSLQPFRNPVAVIAETPENEHPRADVFDLLNIVPYVRKFKTNPVSGKPLDTSALIKLNFAKNAEGKMHDPITYKVFSPHTHIVFLRNTGNVFDMASLNLLAIKPKTWRDLLTDEPFERKDIITIQDPENLASRDLREYDYVKKDKKVDDVDLASDPLRGINVDAAGGASKVLKMLAEKTRASNAAANEIAQAPLASSSEPKEGIVARKRAEQIAYNQSNFTTGRASASFTSTTLAPEAKNEAAMFDEEEYMFDELSRVTKEKDRLKSKGYATILTNYGGLNIELHGDRAPKTVYNFIQLAKQGYYDNVAFHRLIPGFMVQGGDPTGTGSGGKSFWGQPFRDEYDEKGAFKHDARGVMSMANSGPRSNTSQFFFTFRATPHLDGKHTVFGKLVGGEEVLDMIEKLPVRPGGDRPAGKGVVITGIQVLQDPFEAYQARLKARIAKRDQSDETLAKRAAALAEREKDRTTWLGTDLGIKGAPKVKRKIEEVGVGKYLGTPGGVEAIRKSTGDDIAGKSVAASPRGADGSGTGPIGIKVEEFGLEKKKRKAGGFGDFSGW